MPVTSGNKKILDSPKLEVVAGSPMLFNGSFQTTHINHIEQIAMLLGSTAGGSQGGLFFYYPETEGAIALPSSSAPQFGAGSAATGHAWSTGSTVGAASLTATSGTTSTITTNQSLSRDFRGWPIHILSGPNAGQTLTISSNTTGTNSVITVPTQSVAFSASTVYRLGIPRFYVLFATNAGVNFRTYDVATSTWTNLSTTNLPSTFGTGAALCSTPSWLGTSYLSFATGTATSGTATTLVNSSKSWTTNQWVNYQIRIVSGTGAGQIRTITANDSTSVTVAAWTTTPDNTSTYSIEGNDDFLYLTGNNSTTMYRYQISTNTWSSTAVAARPSAAGAATSMMWASEVPDSSWTTESSIVNGRRIYSIAGSSNSTIHIYDIPSNTWSTMTYSPNVETFGLAGAARHILNRDSIYAAVGHTSSYAQQLIRINIVTGEASPSITFPYAPGNSGSGNGAWSARFTEGNTEYNWMYFIPLSHSVVCRFLVD